MKKIFIAFQLVGMYRHLSTQIEKLEDLNFNIKCRENLKSQETRFQSLDSLRKERFMTAHAIFAQRVAMDNLLSKI